MVDSSTVITAPSAGPRLALPPSRLRDESLGRRVAEGDERAFAEIHRRYHGPLYRYCRSIVRHEHDAQDVLQSTLIAAYRALRDGRRDAPLRPWLYRIAHNESISLLRRRRPDAELTPAVPDLAGVEERADVRERMAQLVADLMALPDRQRSALVMRELNGLSHEDIAVVLETTPAAAKQTVFEARRALADLDAGRAMRCDDVCRLISDGDRRQLRGRRVRAHLRACDDCAAFGEAITSRRSDLSALAPGLPAGAGAGLLASVLGGASGRSATGAVSAKALTAGAMTKTLATGLLIAGGVAGYAHLAHGAGRAVGHAAGRPTGSLARPVRTAARSGDPASATGTATGAAATRATGATTAGAGQRRGTFPGAPSRPGHRGTVRRTGRSGSASATAAAAPGLARAGDQSAAAPGRAGRHAGGSRAEGRPAATSTPRGRSAGHAVRRRWATATEPPGQARRTTAATGSARASHPAGTRAPATRPAASSRRAGASSSPATGSLPASTTAVHGQGRGQNQTVSAPAQTVAGVTTGAAPVTGAAVSSK